MNMSNGDRTLIAQDIQNARDELDDRLQKLIRRTQRLLITIICAQTVIIIALGVIAFLAVHNQTVRIRNQVYAGQHDACAIFLEIALGSYGQPSDMAGIRGIEDAREIYTTRGCPPPTLPPPSLALKAAATKYGVKLTY